MFCLLVFLQLSRDLAGAYSSRQGGERVIGRFKFLQIKFFVNYKCSVKRRAIKTKSGKNIFLNTNFS